MINKNTQLCMSLSGRSSNFGTSFHNYLYQKMGLDFVYKAFTTNDLESAIKGIRALGIRGCAISMPFKQACIPFLDELSPSVKAIDAVNTIVNDNGVLKAYNTDYIAVMKLIKHYQLDNEAQVLVHGSGGMAKAVVAAFKHSGFSNLYIQARNAETGQALADLYGYTYCQQFTGKADILVNVTPIGMSGAQEAKDLAFPATLIEQAQTIFDVVAFPIETPLIQYARNQAKQIISGGEVVALQAVEQFELYTKQRPSDELIAEAAVFARSMI